MCEYFVPENIVQKSGKKCLSILYRENVGQKKWLQMHQYLVPENTGRIKVVKNA